MAQADETEGGEAGRARSRLGNGGRTEQRVDFDLTVPGSMFAIKFGCAPASKEGRPPPPPPP